MVGATDAKLTLPDQPRSRAETARYVVEIGTRVSWFVNRFDIDPSGIIRRDPSCTVSINECVCHDARLLTVRMLSLLVGRVCKDFQRVIAEHFV